MSDLAEKLRSRREQNVRTALIAIGWILAALVTLCIGTIVFYNLADDTKGRQAKSDVMMLTTAAKAYRIRYEEYPAKLSDLVEPPDGRTPYIEPDAITDPWQQPYQYDPAGPRNNGEQPDIWTVGHDGKLIGNWSKH